MLSNRFEVPNGWTKIRAADFGFSSPSAILWGAVDYDNNIPRLRIFENCPNLIRQLSSLPLDKNNPEDVDTKAEDHAYDALRYMVSSRPTNIRTAFENMPKTTWRPSDNRFGY
jgi:hypothetical protein